jgi:hypothetical protein
MTCLLIELSRCRCGQRHDFKIEYPANHRCRIADAEVSRFRRTGHVRQGGGGAILCRRSP